MRFRGNVSRISRYPRFRGHAGACFVVVRRTMWRRPVGRPGEKTATVRIVLVDAERSLRRAVDRRLHRADVIGVIDECFVFPVAAVDGIGGRVGGVECVVARAAVNLVGP